MAEHLFARGVYGATMGGMMDAVEAAKRGHEVVVLEWTGAIGAMTTGGLGGAMDYIGEPHRSGLTLQFYDRLCELWQELNPNWADYEIIDGFNPDGRTDYWDWNVPRYLSLGRVLFTPAMARQVLAEMIAPVASKITIIRDVWIKNAFEDETGITVELTNGDSYRASNWHDASYELDLCRKLGVTTSYGRDSIVKYGEEWSAGRRPAYGGTTAANRRRIDDRGNLFKYVQMPPYDPVGTGDDKAMTLVYRMTVSKHANRLPWPKPAGYRRRDFLNYIEEAQLYSGFQNQSSYKKINDHLFGCNGPTISGLSWGYSECETREDRLAYWDKVFYEQAGRYWTCANDPSVPEAVRIDCQKHGLPHDDNQGAGNYYKTPGWSSQLYVREDRRLIGPTTMTDADILFDDLAMSKPDPIGLHGYNMDSHPIRTWPLATGFTYDGHIAVVGEELYQIGLSHCRPAPGQSKRLAVSWGFAQSRSVLCSSRIEPPAQQIGEHVGLALTLATEMGIPVAELDYGALRPELDARGAILTGIRRSGTAPGPSDDGEQEES